jgi:hypothetical protein
MRVLDRIHPPAAHRILLVNADAVQEDRPAVQQDVCAARLDGAKAEGVDDLVDLAGLDHVARRRRNA